MTGWELRAQLRQMIADSFGEAAASVEETAPLFVDHADRKAAGLGAGHSGLPGDSLDRVEFAMLVEEEFGVTISDGEAHAALASIDAAANWLEARVPALAAPAEQPRAVAS